MSEAAKEQRGRLGEQPDVAAATDYVLGRLERELPGALVYHSLAHTRDDVVPAVERLAVRLGLAGEALLLLRTAALFHDIGFVERRTEHEAAGACIAVAELPRFGYSPGQVAAIVGMIMATRLPQSPRTLLERLIADADLDVLGRSDFFERNALLRAELATYGGAASDATWYGGQLHFLLKHRYWTQVATDLRAAGKLQNITTLECALRGELVKV